jgi:hypothetical protein
MSKAETELVRTNIFLSRQERAELARVGKKQNLSAAEVLRRILDVSLGLTSGNSWTPVSAFKNRPISLRGARTAKAGPTK